MDINKVIELFGNELKLIDHSISSLIEDNKELNHKIRILKRKHNDWQKSSDDTLIALNHTINSLTAESEQFDIIKKYDYLALSTIKRRSVIDNIYKKVQTTDTDTMSQEELILRRKFLKKDIIFAIIKYETVGTRLNREIIAPITINNNIDMSISKKQIKTGMVQDEIFVNRLYYCYLEYQFIERKELLNYYQFVQLLPETYHSIKNSSVLVIFRSVLEIYDLMKQIK